VKPPHGEIDERDAMSDREHDLPPVRLQPSARTLYRIKLWILEIARVDYVRL
jgi:hypothetical protein